jgi:penicillin amidase
VEEALRTHHEPVLAVVFANRAGEGGVQIAGWLPRRPLPTGLVPVQGRLRSFDWVESMALESLPRERLGVGTDRWLLAVDQPWPAPGGLDQMEWLWRTGDRAARLESELARLTAERRIDLRTAAELLGDERVQDAPAVVAAILDLARRAGPLPLEAREIARLLARWDGSMATDSVAAAAYHLVLERLLHGLLETPLGPRLFARFVQAPHVRPQDAVSRLVLRAAELRRPGGWTDEQAVSRAARASLRTAWVSLNHRLGPSRDRWVWGRLHRLRFQPLGPARPLPDPLGRAIAASGNGETLELAAHRPGVSFDVERMSVYRIAMDLAAPDRLLSALVPGQSEHPGHRHFDDGLARWRNARLALFPTSRLVIEEESGERLVLEPAL